MAARNRPRSNIVKEDLADEVQLWHSIVDKIRRCAAVHRQFEEVSANIPGVEEEMIDQDPVTTLPSLEHLSSLHRDGLKHAEEELKILTEEPDDLLKNLELLISVRAAFETDLPSTTSSSGPGGRSSMHNTKSSARNLKRRMDPELGAVGSGGTQAASQAAVAASAAPSSAVDSPALTPETIGTPGVGPGGGGRLVSKAASRSGSVAATAIKSEPSGEDVVKSAAAHDKYTQLRVGTLVFLRNKSKTLDGEGILCALTSVLGDGKARRYEVQDPEPDETGEKPAPYKAPLSSLEPIPGSNGGLGELRKGMNVVAVYPDTSTFYRAEVVGGRGREWVRLRFEGEEERDKEMDVERRFVLVLEGR